MSEANSTPTATLPSMRVSYEAGSLDEGSLAGTWHEQLALWFEQAVHDPSIHEANAMVLATADADGLPSSRTVLCKGFDARGVVFFTNYTSAKSHDLKVTRFAAATFPWLAMQRQVNVRGTVEKVSQEETAEYWAERPRGSQLGAWASPQSRVVSGRSALESTLNGIERRFADAEKVPVPPHWGGWRIVPESVEFWQGRPDRLHDRLRFRNNDGAWVVERLAP
ncbi:pyridoxamine 5'-phosphate oxidase [Saccharopolyspora erythraea NRRL 2338]|uniref:Pyridoxine/pyridoxamine 5'-phosphate oxidase n=2 Tax=Saccharopolyspora erythraea TaxID=1836 RepID=PDXH_SACEN|nr:pyridoxamine 5'-phosphate oxidase [Saccharopolyspora erythraea]A4F7G2.1 RecName: Full=Pyridoxine/pyridoxamine 5'-phosphate oxidase; AltName: Full=PNP/PMP oxidase; Short=PNPOx; AltName: Full=Pyridoxal 5'-phosphate synthase [Saccharopolyspora erythraea NRRL 2338]EQD84805.1 pyridoxamine 5'-phosphate oxidase [Saccharopolyspora erythraea D]PFG93787.1 pyridoxamine 5'-phosphate oxidase [Saccharopolyspora erythraea NRRL 2338]QRK90624.1 pyridoxamine 5'-phosphate oxidase [Saccharopolyspora erythraea]